MITCIRQRALAVIALYDDLTDKRIMSAEPEVVTENDEHLMRRTDGYYVLMDDGRYKAGDKVLLDIKVRGFYSTSCEIMIPERLLPDDAEHIRLTANLEHEFVKDAEPELIDTKDFKELRLIATGIRQSYHLLKALEENDSTISFDLPSSQRFEGRLIYITDSADANFNEGTYIRIKGVGTKGSYILEGTTGRKYDIAKTKIYSVTEVNCEGMDEISLMLKQCKWRIFGRSEDSEWKETAYAGTEEQK